MKDKTQYSLSDPPALVPQHVAIIMDGNGRWAKQRGLPRLEGHKAGAQAVQKVVEAARKRGVRYLTLFGFSTENWNRGAAEVSGLMALFLRYLNSELEKLLKNEIRLRAVGALDRLPPEVLEALERNVELTKEKKALDLVLAVSYGGREDIVSSARSLAEEVKAGRLLPEEIDTERFSSHLWTRGIPDPDLLIRTSGELRISNFLLWQLAYAEIVVRPEFWPDFNETLFDLCLEEYAGRERRFGLTSEQIREAQDRG